ncbi:unnamed protein product, partial [Chrysoparadoxa australica]
RPRSAFGSNFSMGSAGELDVPAQSQEGSPAKTKVPWLTATTGIPVPPQTTDFLWAQALQKRRGGFGKMAKNNWQKRQFVLMRNGVLCYFEAESFEAIDFASPPRGLANLTENEYTLTMVKEDHDTPTPNVMVLQGRGQRWKLCAREQPEMMELFKLVQAILKGGSFDNEDITPGQALANAGASFPPKSGESEPELPEGFPRHRRRSKLRNIELPAKSQIASMMSFFSPLLVVNCVCVLLWWAGSSVSEGELYLLLLAANMAVAYAVRAACSDGRSRDDHHKHRVPLVHAADVVQVVRLVKMARALQRPQLDAKGPNPPGMLSEEGMLLAGSTMSKAEGFQPGDISAPPRTWLQGSAALFNVRGKEYIQDRKKVTGTGPIYEMVGMDMFGTEARVMHIADTMSLASVTESLPAVPSQAAAVPPLLVVNVQLPTASPVFMSSAEDGPGYQVVLYYRLTAASAQAYGSISTASEALKLWLEYCKKWEEDDTMKGRLKVMAVVGNMDSLGLPGLITKYNGKPVLINRSGSYVKGQTTSASGEEVRYLEMDINVHRFSYMAKKGLYGLGDRFPEMLLHIGFTIEGRVASELPEALLACTTLNY